MASILAKYISKKVLGETMENKFGKEVCQQLLFHGVQLKESLGPIL